MEVIETHRKVREILQSYGNPEFGDCIVDELCFLFGYPTTTDIEGVPYVQVEEWFYDHDNEWQNDMEESFFDSDNIEGAKSYIDWAYMQYHPDVEIEY